MSSATESAKQPAEGSASDEPNSKRAKVSDSETGNEKNVDSNNGKSGTEKNSSENNNSNSSKNGNKTSTKVVNGNEKETKVEDGGDEDAKYDDDDDDESGNFDGVFDPKIAKSLEQVENIQAEILNLNEKASEEILKVEQKFNQLRRPHFEKRNELLKEIPNFWLTSLANHPIIAPMIESAEDEDCLHYMINLDVEECEDIKSGYMFKLHFVENPYITNDVIVKEFQIVSSEEVVSATTPIEYKDTDQGKRLKQVVENSIAQHRVERHRVGQPQQQQSFFAWLVQPCESGLDEIADILKDQIWPSPLEFFFATPDYYNAHTDDESDDDDDEEIDEEDIDDEEDGVIAEGIDFSEEELDGEEEDEDDVE